ncbi:MAG: tRNA (adenosine(37)-N6)-threonylcarbamoyltransferase complex transferase subunit TsaD [Flavobacteriales bacterium]
MTAKTKIILGIESSCDDTSAAILVGNQIRANIIANQTIHEQFGGVVPELASRAHQENIIPVVSAALKQAQLTLPELDAIAFTQGPGLMGSLTVGTSFAKALGLALNIPIVGVHHMKAHILAHLIDDASDRKPDFPFLCLTVSGGHTQIVRVDKPLDMTILGSTIDDAAGEAFDKAAKMLGLPYPGGPLIDQLAPQGNPNAFQFAKPQIPELNYSFSGLKTSILYTLQAAEKNDPQFRQTHLHDLCASIQNSIVSILLHKLEKAVKTTGIKSVAIAGGVSANTELRRRLQEKEKEGWNVSIPKMSYCTDNAAMIAMAGSFYLQEGQIVDQKVAADPRLNW